MTLYPPPLVPVFPAGYGPTPTDMNNWIQSTLGFQTTGIVFRAEQHTAQTTGTATFTVVNYDTIVEDPYGGWSASSTGNQPAHSWLAPYTGYYEVTITGCIATISTILESAVLQDGSVLWELDESPVGTFFGGGCGHVVMSLDGGVDYIQGQIWTNTSTTMQSTLGRYSSIEISYVSQ